MENFWGCGGGGRIGRLGGCNENRRGEEKWKYRIGG